MDEILERIKLLRLMLDDLERAVQAHTGTGQQATATVEAVDTGPLVFGNASTMDEISYTIRQEAPRSATLGPITASELQGR